MTALELIQGYPTIQADVDRSFLTKRNVYITGICGSIGGRLASECRYALGMDVSGCDWNELKVSKSFHPVSLGDFSEVSIPTKTEIIFHCAAYKHVQLSKENELSFLHNNYGKVRGFQEDFGHTKFVLCSTDKAAGASPMGKSKLAAERYVTDHGGWALRLVNCAYSEGSVLWWWKEGRYHKGPGHFKRYFMQLADAVYALTVVLSLPPGLYTVFGLPEFSLDELAQGFETFMGKKISWGDYHPTSTEEEQERLFTPETEILVDTLIPWLKKIEFLPL